MIIKHKVQNNSNRTSFTYVKPSKRGICCPWIITEADIQTSSMNDQTTFQSTSGTIKPNGFVQPSAQECSQTPVPASKARRPLLLHSPQSSSLPTSSTAGDPGLGWIPHTSTDWAPPSLVSTQNSSTEMNNWAPACNPKHSHYHTAQHWGGHTGTTTLPDKPTPSWCNADNPPAKPR